METDHAKACFALTESLVAARRLPVSAKLRTVGEKHSMLHHDVLLLLYHFAQICEGQILEIGPYVGGSSIAMAMGARDSERQPKRVQSIEPGGQFKDHPAVPTTDILADLRKNLVKREVADLVTITEGYSWDAKIVKTFKAKFQPGEFGLFFIDADGAADRDLSAFRPLLAKGAYVVIDDYCGSPDKTQTTREQVDDWSARGDLLPLGVFGWGTWVGRLL